MDAARFYETQALRYLEDRDRSCVGAEVVQSWVRSLPFGASVVEISFGGGYPITQVLVDSGLAVWAIDTSPTLLRSFRLRCPTIPTQCASALESDYFGRTFEAVLSIGLVSFLREDEQLAFIHRVSEILEPRGHFLFTAPVETGIWQDVATGLDCWSLGRITYTALERNGLRVIRTHVDEGENNYYRRKDWWSVTEVCTIGFQIIAVIGEPVRYQTQLANCHESTELWRTTLAQAKDLCMLPWPWPSGFQFFTAAR